MRLNTSRKPISLPLLYKNTRTAPFFPPHFSNSLLNPLKKSQTPKKGGKNPKSPSAKISSKSHTMISIPMALKSTASTSMIKNAILKSSREVKPIELWVSAKTTTTSEPDDFDQKSATKLERYLSSLSVEDKSESEDSMDRGRELDQDDERLSKLRGLFLPFLLREKNQNQRLQLIAVRSLFKTASAC